MQLYFQPYLFKEKNILLPGRKKSSARFFIKQNTAFIPHYYCRFFIPFGRRFGNGKRGRGFGPNKFGIGFYIIQKILVNKILCCCRDSPATGNNKNSCIGQPVLKIFFHTQYYFL